MARTSTPSVRTVKTPGELHAAVDFGRCEREAQP
jgi:hypothetical protein